MSTCPNPITGPQSCDPTTASPSDLLGILGGSLATEIAGAFASMDTAEEEIARACADLPPELAEWLDSVAFGLLCPSPPLQGRDGWIYLAHCREIFERLIDGGDTREPTAAEICCALAATSTVAPLNGAGMLTYSRAFVRACELAGEEWRSIIPPESIEALEAVHGWRLEDMSLTARLRVQSRQPKKPRPAADLEVLAERSLKIAPHISAGTA